MDPEKQATTEAMAEPRAGANARHGLRRTNADKRRSVERLLRDKEWGKWSDHEIARRCEVDVKTVGNIRKEMILTVEFPQSNQRIGADGRTINTEHIGRQPATEPPQEEPAK